MATALASWGMVIAIIGPCFSFTCPPVEVTVHARTPQAAAQQRVARAGEMWRAIYDDRLDASLYCKGLIEARNGASAEFPKFRPKQAP